MTRRDLQDSEAVGRAAAAIHAAQAGKRAAIRGKNPEAVEKAITRELNAQRDFAADYQRRFPQGRAPGKKGPGKGGKDASTGALTADQWCESYGFAQRTVQRWCKDLLDAERFEKKKAEIISRVWRTVHMEQSASYSSETVEWYTPVEYLNSVREVMGAIDLDPASNESANQAVQAADYYSPERGQDGLKLPWHGRVFLNPPYGTLEGESVAGLFCRKAIEEYRAERVKQAILLVNSVHSQRWQAPLYEFPVCFVDHRISFVSSDGEINENPTFQNIFVYLGRDKAEFAAVFERHGYVMERACV